MIGTDCTFLSLYSDLLEFQNERKKSHSVLFLHSTFPNPNLNIKLRLTEINYSLSFNAKILFQVLEYFSLEKVTTFLKDLLLEPEHNLYVLFLGTEFLQYLEMQPIYCLL